MPSLLRCRYCFKDLVDMTKHQKIAHSMWCEENPVSAHRRANLISIHHEKRVKKEEQIKSQKEKFIGPPLTKFEKNEITKLKLKALHRRGHYAGSKSKISEANTGRHHSQSVIEKIRASALRSDHRRLIKSTRKYVRKDGAEVLLDSSWEEILARRLDDLEINWIRPKDPIIWIDSIGRKRNYFPDFYLIDHRIYLDPKNPAAKVAQVEKVNWLLKNRSDILFLFDKCECEGFTPPNL